VAGTEGSEELIIGNSPANQWKTPAENSTPKTAKRLMPGKET